MLETNALSASYGPIRALEALSLRIAPQRLTALIGPNGCGKSTFLKAVMGFLPTVSGEVLLGGAPVRKLGRRALSQRIAYLPQESHAPEDMTLGEMVELAGHGRYPFLGGPSARDRALFRDALATVGLEGLEARRVGTLSGGQRQRAFLAMVLAQDADLILMDEPVNHLDVRYQIALLSLVRDLTRHHGKTVVTVLHDLNLAAAFADDVAMLKAGRLMAAGPLRQTLTAANVAEVFDIEADIFERDGQLVCLPRVLAHGPAPAEPEACA